MHTHGEHQQSSPESVDNSCTSPRSDWSRRHVPRASITAFPKSSNPTCVAFTCPHPNSSQAVSMCPGHGQQDGPPRPPSAGCQDDRDALPDWENLALPPPHVLSHRECTSRSHPQTKSLLGLHLVLQPLPLNPRCPTLFPSFRAGFTRRVNRSRRSHRCALSSHRHPAQFPGVRQSPPGGSRCDGNDPRGPRSRDGFIRAETLGGGRRFTRDSEDAGEGEGKWTKSSGLFRWVA